MYNHDDLLQNIPQNIAYQREMDEERAGAPLFGCSMLNPRTIEQELAEIDKALREEDLPSYRCRLTKRERAHLATRKMQLEEELEARHEV